MKQDIIFLPTKSLVILGLFFLMSCQKEIDKQQPRQEEFPTAANQSHGHLQQTKNFSSEALLRWMDFQLDLYKANVGSVGGPSGMRFTAYTSIAAYESVVPGMPSYQSLSGQLTDMPAMPETQPGSCILLARMPQCGNVIYQQKFVASGY